MSEEVVQISEDQSIKDKPEKHTAEQSLSTFEGVHSDETQKMDTLNSNLDDLFSKIAQLTSQIQKPTDIPEFQLAQFPIGQEKQFKKYEQENKFNGNQQETKQQKQDHQEIKPNDSKLSMRHFQLGKTIGEGKFGTVHQCKHIPTGMVVALKKVFRSSIEQYRIETEIQNEITILSQISHPNIIKLMGFFGDLYHIFIVLEYVPGVTLERMFKSDSKTVSKVLSQVLNAVKYLHNKKIIHRDIKPQNLICYGDVVKLLDFGYATYVREQPINVLCGTLDYVSPQILQGKSYSYAVDLWAIGILAYELLTGNVPFKGSTKQQKIQNISQGVDIQFPQDVDDSAKDFIKSLLKRQPSERATLDECLEHSFIKEHLNFQLSESQKDLNTLL